MRRQYKRSLDWWREPGEEKFLEEEEQKKGKRLTEDKDFDLEDEEEDKDKEDLDLDDRDDEDDEEDSSDNDVEDEDFEDVDVDEVPDEDVDLSDEDETEVDVVLLIDGKRYKIVPEEEGEEEEELPDEDIDIDSMQPEMDEDPLKDVDAEDMDVDDEYSPSEDDLDLPKKKEGVEKNKLDSRKSISPSGDFPKPGKLGGSTISNSDSGKDLEDIPREKYAIKGDTKSGVKYTPSDAGENRISLKKLLKAEKARMEKEGMSKEDIDLRLEEIDQEYFEKFMDSILRKKGSSYKEIMDELLEVIEKDMKEIEMKKKDMQEEKEGESKDKTGFDPTEDLASGIVDIETKPIEVGMNPDSVTEPSDEEAKIAEKLKDIRKKRFERQSNS